MKYHFPVTRLALTVTLVQRVFAAFVGPICLPSSEEFSRNYTGERLFVAGWGITEKNMASTVKLKVQVGIDESWNGG